MNSNASNRHMQRLPSSRSTDKLSHIKSTSRKIGTDRSAVSKNVNNARQDVTSQQKTSAMAPASRLTKQVRNPIPIRHTLTSKLRMEKANPLLTSSFVPDISELPINGTPSRRSTFYPGMLQIKQKSEFRGNGLASESRPVLKKKAVSNERKIIGGIFKENYPPRSGVQNKVDTANVQSGTVISKPSRILAVNKSLPSFLLKNNILLSTQSRSSAAAANKNVRSSTWNKSIPLSANNVNKQGTNTSVKTKSLNNKTKAVDSRKLDKNSSVASSVQSKKYNTPGPKKLKSILRKSASVGDLRKASVKNDTDILSEIENRTEAKSLNKSLKNVAFYSPLHNTTFTPVNITNTPTPAVLRKRLEDWLAKRGKSSFSFRHLCCFGLPRNASVVPTKLNRQRKSSFIETVTPVRGDQNDVESCLNETITLETDCQMCTHSLERGHETDIENSAPKGSSTPQEIDNCDEDKENAGYLSHPEALDDLRKLVHSGYPRDQCEQWLSLISKSHPGLKEMPQYWECLAALEEARGDFSSAVDCYGRAIVKGADANDIDEHLDDLWEKFCTLSVNSVENKRTPIKKLAVDTKQIFKSTVIKFALQQKAVKRSTKSTDVSMQNVNYIVTPVRRSSRRSTSRFRTTPTVKCVDKLEDLEQNIRETMEFHGNAVLNPGN